MITRFNERMRHFFDRIRFQSSRFKERLKTYGFKVAIISFYDGIFPPEKKRIYLNTISKSVDDFLKEFNESFKNNEKLDEFEKEAEQKRIIWVCWWQGTDNMPELVKMCFDQLNKIVDKNKFEIKLVTLENYQSLVDFPKYIIDKFENNTITMTTMSDLLRFNLLCKYGGYWLDSTVFFTDSIPNEYYEKEFYCQKMEKSPLSAREACQGKWCGFSMAGDKNNILFRYMKDAFNYWWKYHDSIIDYVLIDYLLLSGYKHVPAIRNIIDNIDDNNIDIFEMYGKLNQPYSKDLYNQLTQSNVMHKLTYKMDLKKKTPEGQLTLYGYLYNQVYDIKE